MNFAQKGDYAQEGIVRSYPYRLICQNVLRLHQAFLVTTVVYTYVNGSD